MKRPMGVILMNQKFKILLCFFFFVQFVFNVAREDLYLYINKTIVVLESFH